MKIHRLKKWIEEKLLIDLCSTKVYHLSTMIGIIDEIGKHFERVLRWAYPGGLFLVFLFLSTTSINTGESPFFKIILQWVNNSWGIIFVGSVFIGSAIYLIQSNVISQTLVFLSYPRFKWLNNLRDYQINMILIRGALKANWLIDYPDYAWATYHSTSITGFLLLIFFLTSEADSYLKSLGWPVLVLSILIIILSIWLWSILNFMMSEHYKDKLEKAHDSWISETQSLNVIPGKN